MKKRILLALALILCLVVVCSCQSNNEQRFTVVTSTNPPAATQNLNLGGSAPQWEEEPDYDFDDGSYDPTMEEDYGDFAEFEDLRNQPAVQTPAPTVRGEYAGATPVVIDPIDKPTPTPVPPLTFNFQAYNANSLHLTFEGPAGWNVDDSTVGTFILVNPDRGVDYAAAMTLTASTVTSDLKKEDMEKQVQAMLDGLKGTVKSFSPSNTASRTLLDQTGIYANYKATLEDGTEIAGRVHVTCLNKMMYTVHLTYPRAYTDTYIDNVYARLRKTINVSQ